MPDLTTKTARAKLPTGSNPLTQKLGPGRFLCYRRQTSGRPGSWMLRTAKPTGGYSHETLGIADDKTPANGRDTLSYEQALAKAVGQTVADPSKIAVAASLDEWAEWKCQTASSEKQCIDLRNRARRIGSAFPRKTLKSTTARDITLWVNGIVAGGKNGQARRATANRELATLKAALTRAADQNEYSGSRGWEMAKKYPKADSFGARQVILSPEDEAKLIKAAQSDLGAFLTALQFTGARPGEIRAAEVSDLHNDRLTLRGKTGARTIALAQDKALWFAERTTGSPADAPLLSRSDGTAWPDGGHLKPVKKAVKAADLSPDVTAYAFRHGFISRALSRSVPVAAVAQHCGTSVDMIMTSYAKFLPTQMQEWFA